MNTDAARSWLAFSEPVAAARAAARPVVALESTIIAHGMPYPQNVRTAREVEAVVRSLGAQPATIAVIGGRIRIGLSDEELELLGRSGHTLRVRGIDMLDGTPVLDIKPYLSNVPADTLRRGWLDDIERRRQV